jgi:two-component system KDP operon response regulator KdpE
MTQSILIVEDDVALSRMVATYLRKRGFQVASCTGAREGFRAIYEERPDLVLLDIMMPGMDGWEMCGRLRELSKVPIIILTAKAEERDELRGFELGANDYVTKPFSLKVLTARIRAALRGATRMTESSSRMYDDGTLRVDLERRQVFREGKLINLTPTEYRLLACLVENRGRVVPHEELLERVWGACYTDARDCLSLYIRYLREKLEEKPSEPVYILNRWGVGYWFAPTGSGAVSRERSRTPEQPLT